MLVFIKISKVKVKEEDRRQHKKIAMESIEQFLCTLKEIFKHMKFRRISKSVTLFQYWLYAICFLCFLSANSQHWLYFMFLFILFIIIIIIIIFFFFFFFCV